MLSEILSRGSFSEAKIALSQISPQKYAELGEGKRIVIMVKLKSLSKVDQKVEQLEMRNMVASLLPELIRVGYQIPEQEDYGYVIEHSLIYGYKNSITTRENVTFRLEKHSIKLPLNVMHKPIR